MRHFVKSNSASTSTASTSGKPSGSILREQLLRAGPIIHSNIQVSPPVINLVTPSREEMEWNIEPMEVDEGQILPQYPLEELMELIHEEEQRATATFNEATPVATTEEEAAVEQANDGLLFDEATFVADFDEAIFDGLDGAAEGVVDEAVADEAAANEAVANEAAADEIAPMAEVIPNDGLDDAIGEVFENEQAGPHEHYLLFQKLVSKIEGGKDIIDEKTKLLKNLEMQIKDLKKEIDVEKQKLQKNRAMKSDVEKLISISIKYGALKNAAEVKLRRINDVVLGIR